MKLQQPLILPWKILYKLWMESVGNRAWHTGKYVGVEKKIVLFVTCKLVILIFSFVLNRFCSLPSWSNMRFLFLRPELMVLLIVPIA